MDRNESTNVCPHTGHEQDRGTGPFLDERELPTHVPHITAHPPAPPPLLPRREVPQLRQNPLAIPHELRPVGQGVAPHLVHDPVPDGRDVPHPPDQLRGEGAAGRRDPRGGDPVVQAGAGVGPAVGGPEVALEDLREQFRGAARQFEIVPVASERSGAGGREERAHLIDS
eukprot:CAMPEP_0194299906 /NCGR_PEP_ID=MMETSP0169-20130528/60970_1 /TAXON_ID=218684 /ORGANISM="Corethron pennatum, Strain L29A3" /LENGTH=169 /DNA_ID=CAMNT_0039050031 /DNA_START=270 /DNA_END=779 /DNA_ORIENTATION=+